MIKEALILTALAASPSAQEALPQLVVESLAPRLADFDGKRVLVRGVVHNCAANSCSIEGLDGSAISIGPSEKFDRAIRKYFGRAVTIEATVNAECLSGTLICLDRVGELRDPVLSFPRN